MKILIIGDSFADPSGVIGDTWYRSLPSSVTNMAKAGVGQYKILQQLLSVKSHFDKVIVVVTSEYRVHASQNPFYTFTDHRHHESDLILRDVESRLPDERAQHICYWFKNIFDLKHAVDMHNLILQETHNKLRQKNLNFIPITFFPRMNDIYNFDNQLIDFSLIAQDNQGDKNHLDSQGHKLVLNELKGMI